VIYNAVDANVYSPALRAHRGAVRERHGISEAAVLFLLVGSGFRRKGLPAVLAALARLPAAAHLLVVGEDRRLETFKTMAREHGVRERVTFAGLAPDSALCYGAADAFVLPTLYDSFPDAAMEALAAGLPVVTSTMSGAAELVTEHAAGLVCAARDAEALAGHLETLLDPGVRAGMAERARAAVLPLSPAAMTLKLVLLYKELLEASVAHRAAARAAQAAPAAPAAEAAPLHGEDGLESETLPSGQVPPRPHSPPR
jgi:UDP-glucose:(heptosyl)LPS alpha-1,3-glucosyltransferase